MLSIPIDGYLPKYIIMDLKASYSLIKNGGQVRMFRIPADDFRKAVDAVMQKFHCAFRPTVLGMPIDMTEKPVPEIVVVYDDDTNVAQNAIREEDINGKHD